MAWKRSRTAKFYGTHGNSLAGVNAARANFRTGAVATPSGIPRPYEWARGGRAGSYPSRAGGKQVGDQRRGRTLGDETHVVGLPDEEAADSPAYRNLAKTEHRRS